MTTVCTLLLIRTNSEILLAMKKRGFGEGRWNGVGGKVEAGETVEQAMIRECQEEIGVTPTTYHKVAVHNFEFLDGSKDQEVHVFESTVWEGEPTETDEMAPRWFALRDIPYGTMWQDDQHWLPQVLVGKKLRARFTFDGNENMLTHEITEIQDLT